MTAAPAADSATYDDSVLADAPDTTTGKEHLLQNDEAGPGPGV